MGMFRVRRDPFWLLIIAIPALFLASLIDEMGRSFYLLLLAPAMFVVVFRLGFDLLKRLNPSPVPDSVVREMLDLCTRNDRGDDWILVKIPPKVSLEEAQRKVGSSMYSEEDRLQSLLAKFHMVAPGWPNVAIFYAPNKGFLLANRLVVGALERKYGRWMLDTWYSLNGALGREGLSTRDLDTPQMLNLR